MKKIFSRLLNFIIHELFVNFLLCFLLALIGLGIIFIFDINPNIESIITNISCALISLPIVFIVRDLYINFLQRKTKRIINSRIEKQLNDLFLKFLFFTTQFYNTKKNFEEQYEKLLLYDRNKVFNEVSENVHYGYFIFSIFERFNKEILSIINENQNTNTISIKELALLYSFIDEYEKLNECFSFINENDFIKFSKLNNYFLEESKDSSSDDYFPIYTVKEKIDEEKNTIHYLAKYKFPENNGLMCTYKISGMKSQEISNSIHRLYSLINQWLKLKGRTHLELNQYIITANRINLGRGLAINKHMDNYFFVHNTFN